MYKKILITTDGSARSELAVDEGVQLGQDLGAEMVVFHVIPDIPVFVTPYADRSGDSLKTIIEELEKNGQDILDKVKAKFPEPQYNIKTKLTRGNPAYEICSEARDGRYDLVVLASRGLGEIKGYIMGSVSNRVVRHAGCSVLVIK